MVKIKSREIRGLILVNREVISNNSLKNELKEKELKPAHQGFIASKNINALKKHADEFATKENDLKLAATNKDDKGNPVTKKGEGEQEGMILLDIPVELQAQLQKEIDALRDQEIDINLVPFSLEVSDIICTYLSDTALEDKVTVITGYEKTELLLEKLTVLPVEAKA